MKLSTDSRLNGSGVFHVASRSSAPRSIHQLILSFVFPYPGRRSSVLHDISSVGAAFQRKRHTIAAMLTASLGAILGAGMSILAFALKPEAAADPRFYVLIAGALMVSAPTVFEFTYQAFKNPVKAIGFTLLLEGALVASHNPFINISALVLLASINALHSASKILR